MIVPDRISQDRALPMRSSSFHLEVFANDPPSLFYLARLGPPTYGGTKLAFHSAAILFMICDGLPAVVNRRQQSGNDRVANKVKTPFLRILVHESHHSRKGQGVTE